MFLLSLIFSNVYDGLIYIVNDDRINSCDNITRCMSISIAIGKTCAIEVADLRWMAAKIFDGNHSIATAKQTTISIYRSDNSPSLEHLHDSGCADLEYLARKATATTGRSNYALDRRSWQRGLCHLGLPIFRLRPNPMVSSENYLSNLARPLPAATSRLESTN